MRYGRFSSLLIGTFGFFLLILFQQPASAVIYKWTDEQGRVLYTDDILQIPRQFRKPPYLIKGPGFPFPKTQAFPAEPQPNMDSAEGGESGDTQEKETAKLTQAELKTVRSVVSYLESEVKRNEGFTKMMPSEGTGKRFVANIKESLPGKKNLAEKLSAYKSPEIQPTPNFLKTIQPALDFLKTSIEADEQAKVTGPRMKRRTVAILNRLKQEMETETRLIEQLNKVLKEEENKEP